MMAPDGGAAPTYRQRSERFATLRDRCAARSRRLTHARLAVFAAGAALLFWPGQIVARLGVPGLISLAALLLVLFLALVVRHSRENQRRDWYDQLVRLNDEGLARLARDWTRLPAGGPESPTPGRALAEDLDLFGPASLATLLATVGTAPGRDTLQSWLLDVADPATVRARQAAVSELAPLIDLREEITARGRLMAQTTAEAVHRFFAWAEGEPWLLSRRPWLTWAAWTLPPIALVLLALNALGLVSYATWAAVLVFNLALSFTVRRQVHAIFDRAFAQERAFQQYAALFRRLSETRFQSGELQRLQGALSDGGVSAHRQMKRLDRLLRQAELRFSMLYGPTQALTLWDFQVLRALEGWQRTSGRRARAWLATLGEADALAAMATLAHDNPGWAFPQIIENGPPIVSARDIGHPLLPEGVRVGNDVHLGPPGSFLLVTGSNMSGKSTLLRAIGMNVVLARAGAPVCASEMKTPVVRLETSMRVHDSLQLGLSHFMAELERLRAVVEAARRARHDGGPLLYLLDDIFQGTNSEERRIAARKVIAHLVAAGAIGGVTSHDLQLAETEDLAASCVPVHFSERIEEGPRGPSITFDYKLRPGFASSKNALKLLELVGLDGGGDREPQPPGPA